MELYVGGYAQGKLDYVMRIHPGENLLVMDGTCVENRKTDVESPENDAESRKTDVENRESGANPRMVVNHFHLWVKAMLQKGENPEQQIEEFIKKHENVIVISDEIGNGIVPMEQREREFRERLGRILIQLAAEAERVERVICGMGQRLK